MFSHVIRAKKGNIWSDSQSSHQRQAQEEFIMSERSAPRLLKANMADREVEVSKTIK